MDLLDALVNIAGLAIIIVVTYMLVRNVLQPRFLFPWLRKREKEQLLERGRWLLDEAELESGERERVESAISTLTIRGRHSGESWTRQDPFHAARDDINEVWLRHDSGNAEQQTATSTGES